MKIRATHLGFICLLSTSSAIAGTLESRSSLNTEREQVVKQYLIDLQAADYQNISELFVENGMVVSTSRGKVNAKDFFYSFLPEIESASTELHQLFVNQVDSSRYAARFHFNFKLKDNEVGEGEYVDEFVFANNSAKLLSVYMFENLKFENNAASDI